ncbi:hypothetical protein HDV00_003299 [Rhizophlyctis rosea]|nr:hypothetical protein HDV00_003299 [Rhizophlyctis rosea]
MEKLIVSDVVPALVQVLTTFSASALAVVTFALARVIWSARNGNLRHHGPITIANLALETGDGLLDRSIQYATYLTTSTSSETAESVPAKHRSAGHFLFGLSAVGAVFTLASQLVIPLLISANMCTVSPYWNPAAVGGLKDSYIVESFNTFTGNVIDGEPVIAKVYADEKTSLEVSFATNAAKIVDLEPSSVMAICNTVPSKSINPLNETFTRMFDNAIRNCDIHARISHNGAVLDIGVSIVRVMALSYQSIATGRDVYRNSTSYAPRITSQLMARQALTNVTKGPLVQKGSDRHLVGTAASRQVLGFSYAEGFSYHNTISYVTGVEGGKVIDVVVYHAPEHDIMEVRSAKVGSVSLQGLEDEVEHAFSTPISREFSVVLSQETPAGNLSWMGSGQAGFGWFGWHVHAVLFGRAPDGTLVVYDAYIGLDSGANSAMVGRNVWVQQHFVWGVEHPLAMGRYATRGGIRDIMSNRLGFPREVGPLTDTDTESDTFSAPMQSYDTDEAKLAKGRNRFTVLKYLRTGIRKWADAAAYQLRDPEGEMSASTLKVAEGKNSIRVKFLIILIAIAAGTQLVKRIFLYDGQWRSKLVALYFEAMRRTSDGESATDVAVKDFPLLGTGDDETGKRVGIVTRYSRWISKDEPAFPTAIQEGYDDGWASSIVGIPEAGQAPRSSNHWPYVYAPTSPSSPPPRV